MIDMNKVTGLGGVFLKVENPEKLAAWYEKHLGIYFQGKTYTSWPRSPKNGESMPGYNVFSFLKKDSDYFNPSNQGVMINLVVEDLFPLLEKLKEEGVEIIGDPVDEEYGKFGWILDPEGNKIELWEPPKQ
jgi:predicted enzyme related to lactoylglutathione lyase